MLLLSSDVFFIPHLARCLSRECVSCLQSCDDNLTAFFGILREWVRSGGPQFCDEFTDTL